MNAPRISLLIAACCLLNRVSFGESVPTIRPTDSDGAQVDFERHVMGILGRSGCSLGSCHGSFQGKGNFRISLFGYDPSMDAKAIVRDSQGRRINLLQPDDSLLLLKATGQMEHGGGRRFDRQSREYQILRQWIAEGAKHTPGSGNVVSLKVDPPEIFFADGAGRQTFKVLATFETQKGLETEDVTSFSELRLLDDAVARLDGPGNILALKPGETLLVGSYRGQVAPVRVLAQANLPKGAIYPENVLENGGIDTAINSKLRRLNLIPSGPCADGEFLRRVTLDTIGNLPSSAEVRAFLEDPSPDKWSRKIDELLEHPMHAALWATRFSDITGNNTDTIEQPQNLKARRSQMWHDWLRKRFERNQPYDELVHDILCATSREQMDAHTYLEQAKRLDEQLEKGFGGDYANRKTLDLFWRRQQQVPVEQWGEKVAAAFLGVRLECAQCHKHPFDRWTQKDYRAFANIFSRVSVGQSPEMRKEITAINNQRRENAATAKKNANQVIQIREVFIGPVPQGNGRQQTRNLTDPDTNGPLPAKALGGPAIETATPNDPREALFAWMRSPENPFFAPSVVNRIWGHYMGRGIVDPVDDFAVGNPPSNPALLEFLAQSFVESGYDFRQIERMVLNSAAYQRTSQPNSTNSHDRISHSHSLIRPLMAEVVVDILSTATGVPDTFGNDAPQGTRALEVGASRVSGQYAYAFRIFGRPPRSLACDCDRAMEPALPQKLYLMADPAIQAKLVNPNNRLKALLADYPEDVKALEELFLSTVSRFPTEKEKSSFDRYRKDAPDRRTAYADTLWALLNTTEFIFNH